LHIRHYVEGQMPENIRKDIALMPVAFRVLYQSNVYEYITNLFLNFNTKGCKYNSGADGNKYSTKFADMILSLQLTSGEKH